jgi:hypothetical protein
LAIIRGLSYRPLYLGLFWEEADVVEVLWMLHYSFGMPATLLRRIVDIPNTADSEDENDWRILGRSKHGGWLHYLFTIMTKTLDLTRSAVPQKFVSAIDVCF